MVIDPSARTTSAAPERALSGRALLLVVVAALVATSPGATGCDRSRPKPEARPSAAVVPRPVLEVRRPTFSEDERELMQAEAAFWAALDEVLSSPGAISSDPGAIAAHFRARLDPERPAIAALAPTYHSLSPERRLLIHQAVFQQEAERIQRVGVGTAAFADQFRDRERNEQFREVMEAAFREWAESGSLWVVGGFGPDAVGELKGWALGIEEDGEWDGRSGATARPPEGDGDGERSHEDRDEGEADRA